MIILLHCKSSGLTGFTKLTGILTSPVDLQAVLSTQIVRFPKAPVGEVKWRSITPQPLTFLMSEPIELLYWDWELNVRNDCIEHLFKIKANLRICLLPQHSCLYINGRIIYHFTIMTTEPSTCVPRQQTQEKVISGFSAHRCEIRTMGLTEFLKGNI